MRKSILAVVASGLILSGIAGVMPASAAEHNYSCNPCATVNGPDESVRYNEGTNYSFAQVCVTLWKWNGGNNYNTVGHSCVSGAYTEAVCTNSGTVTGHGEVYNSESSAHMAGHQDNYSC
jgi:hypothetical protein